MDLWIRSQDRKELIKTNYIRIVKKENDYIVQDEEYCNLGIYKTEERALEVLDEIQKYLEKMGTDEILTDKVGIINGIKHYGIVYEMPIE